MDIFEKIQLQNSQRGSLILKSFQESETFEKSKSGIYQNTPENRKLNRVGLKFGNKKENIKSEQDKLRDVAENILKKQLPKEIEFKYVGYSDTNGKSMYFKAYKKGEDEKSIKVRFSDHSVENKDRISNEAHFSFKEINQENNINKIGYLLGLNGYKYEPITIKRQIEVSENNIRNRKIIKEYIPEKDINSKIIPTKKYIIEDEIKNVWQYTKDK